MERIFISIIIAYYKNERGLELILESLVRQTNKNFEVVIAEDDVRSELPFLSNYVGLLTIQHICQGKNLGFTKTSTLNKAVLASKGDYLVFIDGDCILHRRFLEAYQKHAKPSEVLFGRRVMLSKTLTLKLVQGEMKLPITLVQLVRYGCTRLKYAIPLIGTKSKRTHGIWGHNWGVWKEDLIAINGFDEDYVHAGVGEDVDIEWRLQASGLTLYSIRYLAIQYHMYHNENYTKDDIQIGMKKYQEKKRLGQIYCVNGINKSEMYQ